jgi:hypothetical protein
MSPWVSVGALALSVITTVVAVTAVIVQMRASVATLSRDDDRREKRELIEREARDKREDAATRELTDFLVMLKSFMAAQTEINKKVEIALTGVMSKVEGLEQHIQQSIAIKELLIEVMKKTGKIAIE